MKKLVLLLLPFMAITTFAQSTPPDPFLIGVHGFAPEFDPVHHVCHYVRGVMANPVTLDERQLFLSATHFQLARDLGANLISTTIHPDFVFTPTTDNVVHQICDAASPTTGDTLRVGLLDFGISNFLAGERIMLHPESDMDFGQRGYFEVVPAAGFNRLPVDSANLASPLDLPFASVHAIKMEAGKGVVSGVVNKRKEDLSLFREWMDSTSRLDKGASGLYIVSVTAQLLAPLGDSDSDLPLMHLDISTVDSANALFDRNLRFTLRERHFFDSLDQLITTPIEVVLGMIELREVVNAPDSTPVAFVDYRRSDNTVWADTTLLSYAKILGRVDRDSTARVTAKWEAFDITLSYDDNASATFLLDAVCLSSPRTFAMFHPEHRIFYPSTEPDPPAELEPRLTAWQHTRAGFTSRVDAILTDNGRVATPFPALRFLFGPEQGLHSAQWPLSSVANLLLRERSGNRSRIFCATGYSESPEVSAAFSRRFASGYYCYPVPADYLSPVYPDSTPGSYHHHINRADIRGFVETSRRYRNHAETRKQLGTVHPWLPFVQNHTNLYADSLGKWATWDFDPLREPTAAELRHQCNIALAHAADGLLFYQFSSAPWITANPFWPRDTATWNSDYAAGHPFSDPNAGSIGFVDQDPTTGRPIPRRADWNGESKWDSAATYINEFLRPVGYLIKEHLGWQGAKIWSIRNHQDAGVNSVVNQIVSMKQDAPDPIDEEDSTFVIVSEFVHRGTDENYLLVLNGRTHPIEGHRHITVKLDLAGSPDTKWLVENVLTGDIWLVRPTATPDPLTTANGFTDYFKPGDAALYRLVPADRPETLLPADFPANFFVTPDAAMTMTASNVHTFQPYKGVFVDGSFFAYGAQFTAANEVWQGIHARNDGSVYLDNCVLDGGGVVAGSLGSATVVDTRIDNVPYALYNVGGSLYSTRTLASECSDGYAWIDGPITYIDTDAATATSWPASWGSGIDMHGGGFVDICNTTLSGFVTGVFSRGGMLTTDIVNRLLDGRNHINAVSNVLITDKEGWIDFGDTLGGYGTNNCFSLQDLVNGYHVWGGGNGVNAVDSYWGSQQLNLFGTYNIGATRLVCGIPFTGETGARQLSKSMTPPPANNTKRALMQAYRDSNHVLLRSLLCMQCGSHRSTGKRLISSGIPQFDARISRICATHS